jgi:membrane protein DedA with SNARE-associated domain
LKGFTDAKVFKVVRGAGHDVCPNSIWLLFLSLRFSSLDIRRMQGIGSVMLIALAVALLAPVVATGLAGAALVRQPRAPLNLLVFGCAIAALVGQMFLFLISRWR